MMTVKSENFIKFYLFLNYLKIDGQVLLRDCYLDMPTPTREFCDQEDNYECNKCTGVNCNTDTKRVSTKCYSCQGLDCLDPFESNALIVDCRSECYIGIDGKLINYCFSILIFNF